MKQLFLITFSTAIFGGSCFAKIWRVNNMPGVTADFATAQAAHDGAGAGDTIHLEPSVNDYGTVTCTKPLVWLGIGAFLTENPGHQFSNSASVLGQMYFNGGSDGSTVSVNCSGGIAISESNITIYRSYIAGAISTDANATNLVISQCFIATYVILNSTNTIFSNNIVGVGIQMGSPSTSAIIANNVFNYVGRNENYLGISNIYNSVFQNNISVKGGSIAFYNSAYTYNICPDSSFPSGEANQLNVNMDNVFANSTGSTDQDYQLKTGSPAIGSGYAGTDVGAFGGSTPFKLALQPPIPAITSMSTPSSTGGNLIQVTFSAKGNN